MKSTVAIAMAYFFGAVLSSCGTADSQKGTVAQADEGAIAPLLMRQLYACWTPPVGANVTATVRFSLNRNGSLAGEPTLVKTTTGTQSQAVAESALHAVRRCAPLKLPADKYESWKEIEAVFDPRAICDDVQQCRNSDSAR